MHSEAAGPVESIERHTILDALRGWALLGILVANMVTFIGFGLGNEADRAAAFGSVLDDPAELLIEWLVVGKFYSIFSLLFGIGFALQLERLEARGEGAARYLRRLAILFAIGLAHLTLLWMGDIVALYAVMGVALLLFRRASDPALLRWALILWLLPIAWSALIHFAGINPAAPIYARAMQGFVAAGIDLNQSPMLWYREAGFAAQFAIHPAETWLRVGDLTYQLRPAKVLAMFLFGLWIGRRRIYAELEVHRPLLRRLALFGLGLGLPLSLARVLLDLIGGDGAVMAVGEEALYCLSTPLLAIGYASGFALLWQAARRNILAWTGPAGRMALTNYIGQSLIQSLLFLGYGLGLTGRFGLAFVLPFALLIFAAQVAFSAWWLARFRFGPLEWLWRSATWGRAQPMKISSLFREAKWGGGSA